MFKSFAAALFSIFLLTAISACSPIGVYNAITFGHGKDVMAARNLVYGDLDRQTLDIYRPADDGVHPVLFFIYGGGWNAGAKSDYEFVGQNFAARGYVTVIADYRLVPAVRYPAFIEDGARALAWVEQNIAAYGGDMNRLVLMGHSAGAYNAVMLAADPQFLRAAGVQSPVRAVVGLSGPYDFYPFDVTESQEAFGQASDPEATQPVNLVTRTAPPMLLINGTSDTTVAPRNAAALSARLRAVGVPVVEKYYEGWDHGQTVTGLGGPLQSELLDDVLDYLAPITQVPAP